MKFPEMKTPTKAQLEDHNRNRRERDIRKDIAKIDEALQSSDMKELESVHKHLDGKYQYCIGDWGKSMYNYSEKYGFSYEFLDMVSLRENLTMMKPKLEAFIYGYNAIPSLGQPMAASASDVSVTVNNTINISITFEEVKEKIEEMTSLTNEQTEEILEKITEIEMLVKGSGSKKSKWEKIKPILVWLADKSFDVAMTIMPLLLKLQQ